MAPMELKVRLEGQVGEKLASRLSQASSKPVPAGTFQTTVLVTVSPGEQLMLDKGIVTEDELSQAYADAIQAGQRISYHY